MSAVRALTFPVLATTAALFLLYTNWPVVAAQRGIVPAALAGAIPALLGLAVLHQVAVRRRPFVVDRTLLLMLLFLLVLLISMVRAEGYEVAWDRIWVYLTEGLLIAVLVRNAIRTLPELRAAVVAVLAAGCLLAGLTVFQMVTDNYDQEFMGLAPRTLEHLEDLPPSARQEVGLEDRARGPVDEPNRFAQILLMAACLAAVLAMNARRWRGALAGWACVGLLMAGVLLTYSRGALVTMVVLLALAVPMRLLRPGRFVLAMGLGGVITFAAVPGMAERIGTMAGVAGLFDHAAAVEPDGATRGRTTEMLAALAAYMDHPVIGLGPGQYFAYHSVRYQSLPEISFREIPTPRRAHNLYLELAADTGTIGLVVFLTIPLLLLLELGRLRRCLHAWHPGLARTAAGFSMALLAYLGTGVFLHLAFERYYWLLVALAASAAAIIREAARSEVPPAWEPWAAGWPADGGPWPAHAWPAEAWPAEAWPADAWPAEAWSAESRPADTRDVATPPAPGAGSPGAWGYVEWEPFPPHSPPNP